jgi:hypothetical protein
MAAETLQKFSKDAVPLLLKIVKEGPPESQAGAAFGLGRLHENAPPPESVAALHALLKDAKGETRTAVIASLGEFSSDAREALPDLVAVLRDDSPELRITAALALEKISAAVHDTTLPVLFQALATGAPSHRLEIVTALDRWNLEVVAASVKDAALGARRFKPGGPPPGDSGAGKNRARKQRRTAGRGRSLKASATARANRSDQCIRDARHRRQRRGAKAGRVAAAR